jgi:hypothetical protein
MPRDGGSEPVFPDSSSCTDGLDPRANIAFAWFAVHAPPPYIQTAVKNAEGLAEGTAIFMQDGANLLL